MVSVLDTVKNIVTICLNKKQKFNIIYNSIKEYLSLLTEEDFKALVKHFDTYVKLTSLFFCFIALKYSHKTDFFKSYITETAVISPFFFLSSVAIYEIVNGNLKPLPAFYKRFLRDSCLQFEDSDIKVNRIRFLDVIKLTHPLAQNDKTKENLKYIMSADNITVYRFI